MKTLEDIRALGAKCVLIAGIWIGLGSGLWACSSSEAGAFSESACSGDSICMTFRGDTYYVSRDAWLAPHPTLEPGKPGFALILPSNLEKIGTPERVTSNVGRPGFDVLRIPGVDPSQAVASLFLTNNRTSGPFGADLLLWLRVGLEIRDVRGLCPYEAPRVVGCDPPGSAGPG
jgi:hypothetical protein